MATADDVARRYLALAAPFIPELCQPPPLKSDLPPSLTNDQPPPVKNELPQICSLAVRVDNPPGQLLYHSTGVGVNMATADVVARRYLALAAPFSPELCQPPPLKSELPPSLTNDQPPPVKNEQPEICSLAVRVDNPPGHRFYHSSGVGVNMATADDVARRYLALAAPFSPELCQPPPLKSELPPSLTNDQPPLVKNEQPEICSLAVRVDNPPGHRLYHSSGVGVNMATADDVARRYLALAAPFSPELCQPPPLKKMKKQRKH